MPEATILCIDSSDHMRNGDYFPSRLMATQEVCNLVIGSKMQSNPENTIGFLTMGGKACAVRETLTADVDRVMASITSIPVSGGLHFIHGLQIASLALSHRTNPRSEKRIVAFVGSPLGDAVTPQVLEKLAKKLRKDDVSVDIVSIGQEENNERLEKFVSVVSKNSNSHFMFVRAGLSLVDSVITSPVMLGNDAAADTSDGAQPSAGAAGGGGGFEFGVDPSADPELAMVLRMSMEEERRRIEKEAAEANGGAAPAPATEVDPDAPAVEGAGAAPAQLTEEEEFELALKMSLEAEQAAVTGPDATTPQAQTTGSTTAEPAVDPAFAAALEDAEFMDELANDIGVKKDEDDDKQ